MCTQIDAKYIHSWISLKTWVAAVSSGTGVTVGMWSNFTRWAAWAAAGMLEVAAKAASVLCLYVPSL
jgi:hypothetical protein